jgi:hypothetical protein
LLTNATPAGNNFNLETGTGVANLNNDAVVAGNFVNVNCNHYHNPPVAWFTPQNEKI